MSQTQQAWGSNTDALLPLPPLAPDADGGLEEGEEEDDIMAPNPNNWYFDEERLENTPSRRGGIDADRELMFRQQSANFIQDMGQRLQVNQLCINTAIVYMHRFFMCHSFSTFSRNNVSTASIFLAAKVEEQPRKLEYVIKVAHYCLHRDTVPAIDVKSEAYATQCTDLVNTENVLLQTLGFDVGIDHPHTHVVKCCQLVRASKDLAQTSYFMATNSLHLTTMCMQYKPSVVACVCIHLACKWSNWEIPRSKEGREWYWYVDDSVTPEQLEALTTEFLTIFNKSPSRLKKKIISLSAATSGSSGMNMSNFPQHFNIDQFNKQPSSLGGQLSASSKPRVLPPYSKPGQQVSQNSGVNQPLPVKQARPSATVTREQAALVPPHGVMKPSSHHGAPPPPPPPPLGNNPNKHNPHANSNTRPIPVHHSGGTHSGSTNPPSLSHKDVKLPYSTQPLQAPHGSFPLHHQSRPGIPAGNPSGGTSQSHTSNSQSIHNQALHAQKLQSNPQSHPHRPPVVTNQQPKPLLPPGSLSMKLPFMGVGSMGNKMQPPPGILHSGQVKRPYSEVSRPENASIINPKRECLTTDARRNMPVPQPPQQPPQPTKAQLQSLATQARAREKTEKMISVQMAMMKKPHDNLTWAGSNKPSVPELPPHNLTKTEPPYFSAHSHQVKPDYSHSGSAGHPSMPPAAIPKHDFSAVTNSSNQGHSNSSASGQAFNTSVKAEAFAQQLSTPAPVAEKPDHAIASANNSNASHSKPDFMHNSKEITRKPDMSSTQSIRKELMGIPPLLPGHSTSTLGLTIPRSDFSVTITQKGRKSAPPPPPPASNFSSMPSLEPAPAIVGFQYTNDSKKHVSEKDKGAPPVDLDDNDQSSGSKKKKKKKEHKKDKHKDKEHKKHKEKHRDKEEKKHKDKHRDKEDKKHKDKAEK